jgi:hypothetical protein
MQEDLLYLIMADNSLKIIKPQNFLEEESIKFITPPEENLKNLKALDLIKHPHQGENLIF